MRLEMKYVILLMQTDLLFLTQENTRVIENVDVAYRFDGEIMVLIQFFENDKANRELILDHIYEKFPQITSLQYVVNSKANDLI
jgi:23S rRNA (uracil1939-C5)-methyltransferase